MNQVAAARPHPWSEEVDTFWDWAFLELLVQSGLRIEEASELTTLDILKRQISDGRIYYLLHIKPSKFERARVLPIGNVWHYQQRANPARNRDRQTKVGSAV